MHVERDAGRRLTQLLPVGPGGILALRVEIQLCLYIQKPQQGDLVEPDLCRS